MGRAKDMTGQRFGRLIAKIMKRDKKERMKKGFAFWDKMMHGLAFFLVLTVCWSVWTVVSPDEAPVRLIFACDQWTMLTVVLLALAVISEVS